MKTSFLLVIFTLTISIYARGNQDCIWTSSKAGITIKYIAPCNFENQNFIDSFLNKVITTLNRQDTSIKFLVMIDYHQLSFPGAKFSNFFSIGFDTLRLIDDDFIFKYYWDKESYEPLPLNTKGYPLDINSSTDRSILQCGIKILYDRSYRVIESDWQDILKMIVYSSNNLNQIKSLQRRDTVRYNTNGWYVSLMTLDTFVINKIIGRQSEEQKKETVQHSPKSNSNYWLYGIFGLAAIGIIIYVVRQYSR